jgi:hypothetical protein
MLMPIWIRRSSRRATSASHSRASVSRKLSSRPAASSSNVSSRSRIAVSLRRPSTSGSTFAALTSGLQRPLRIPPRGEAIRRAGSEAPTRAMLRR